MSEGADPLLLTARFSLLLLALALFGSACFAIYAPSDLRRPLNASGRVGAPALAALSAMAWIVLLGRQMTGASGLPSLDVLQRLCLDTGFGRALAAAMVVGALLAGAGVAKEGWRWLKLALAGGLLVSIAFVGHSAASVGATGALRIAIMAAHLLAAGAWLGGLPPLAAALRRDGASASILIHRFGTVGAAAVALVLVTGLGSLLYMLTMANGRLGGEYVRTLLVKLALVAALLILAAINRFRLTPMMSRSAGRALSALRKSVFLELALGLGVIAAVALLGQLDPSM